MHKQGLIVGKFCPLHIGHEYVIREAQKRCESLYILSYTRPEFPRCGPENRRKWLFIAAPEATILVLDDTHNIPDNDAPDRVHREFTAKICAEKFGICPDVVFTSESYGDGFARHLSEFFKANVEHISIDASREKFPISGTEIRLGPFANREYLSPFVYEDFVDTVCFIGAESTGKSTLSKYLAEIYNDEYVEEYGRTLWTEKDGKLVFDDYLLIAKTHIKMEEEARRRADRVVFIDTSPLTTLFYALEYVGSADPALYKLACRSYDHVFLCHPDFPMVQDGWREDEDFRRAQHEWYIKALAARDIAYTDLRGSFDAKVQTIKDQLNITLPQS